MDVRPALALVALAIGCAPGAPSHVGSPITALGAGAAFTVIEAFSATCPCQRAHDALLVAMMAEYGPRGVRFVVLDAETGRTQPDDDAEALARGYLVPIRRDASAALVRSLGGEYATYSVVVDREGRVRYAGGIDSDHDVPSATSRHYLRDALDALLAGREPEIKEGKALGCVLSLPEGR